MGYYTEPNGTKSFRPDDTDTKLFVQSTYSLTLEDITEIAQAKFGHDVALNDIIIEAEHIHTRCIGHDVYDPADHDLFFELTLSRS